MKKSIRMFAAIKSIAFIVLVAIIGFSFTACDEDGDNDFIDNSNKYLSGILTITPNTNIVVGTKLTANYTGSENVSFQWNRIRDDVTVGNSKEFSPSEAASYTVTISAAGYISRTSGVVVVSSNITWTAVPANNVFSGVISASHFIMYGNNKFVAGYGSLLGTSTDGINWTVSNYAFDRYAVNDIAWGSNKFVAVGYGGNIATSTNGTTWTAVTNKPFGTSNIYSIIYGNSRFIAATPSSIATSTDGINWTLVTNSSFGFQQIVYGNGKFVACNGKTIITSTDGTNWSKVAESDFNIDGIAYGNNKFVAVGWGDYKGQIITSTDGINWTAVKDTAFGSTWIEGIAWGNNKFVAVGWNGKAAYSLDGVNWTAFKDTTLSDNFNIYSVVWGNNKFVILGVYGSTLKMAHWNGN